MDDRRRVAREDSSAPSEVIVRSWSARLSPGRAADYVEFFRRVLRPQLRALPGFHRADILVALDGGELVVETRWHSMVAVHGFAGDDVSRAVVEPEALAMFVDYDRTVRHFEVLEG